MFGGTLNITQLSCSTQLVTLSITWVERHAVCAVQPQWMIDHADYVRIHEPRDQSCWLVVVVSCHVLQRQDIQCLIGHNWQHQFNAAAPECLTDTCLSYATCRDAVCRVWWFAVENDWKVLWLWCWCAMLQKLLMRPGLSLLQRRNILLSSSSSSSSSSRSSSAAVQRINSNLTFMPASSAYLAPSSTHLGDASQRPIVLIYAWLTAKLRHIHKYANLYLGIFLRTYFNGLHVCFLTWLYHIHCCCYQCLKCKFGRPGARFSKNLTTNLWKTCEKVWLTKNLG